jgi:two-component system, NarL family, nitrate/nitrite response regulator NarL
MVDSIHIAIVNDNYIFRAGLVNILTRDSEMEVIAEGLSIAHARDIALRVRPHVILVDLSSQKSGIEVIAEVKRLSPSTRAIMITGSEATDDIVGAYNVGAFGYILKDAEDDELRRAVRLVHGGETYITPTLASRLIAHSSITDNKTSGGQGLTTREEDVVHKVGLGMTNKEIARACNISEKTVKHHMTNIMDKLCVRNRVEVALLASSRWGGDATPVNPDRRASPDRPVDHRGMSGLPQSLVALVRSWPVASATS